MDAKTFFRLVEQMRKAQRNYFASRSSFWLVLALARSALSMVAAEATRPALRLPGSLRCCCAVSLRMLGGSPPWGASAPPRPRPPNPPPPARVPFGRFVPSTLANGCAFRGFAPPFNPPASWARCRSPLPQFSACFGLAGRWPSLATLALRTRKATPGLHGSAFGLRFTFAPCAPPCSPSTLGSCLDSPRIVHGSPRIVL